MLAAASGDCDDCCHTQAVYWRLNYIRAEEVDTSDLEIEKAVDINGRHKFSRARQADKRGTRAASVISK